MSAPGSRWFQLKMDRGRGARIWDVRDADEGDSHYMIGAMGRCLRNRQTILVDPNHEDEFSRGGTVFHELVHGAWPVARAHDMDEEERVVRAIEKRLWPVLYAHGLRWPARRSGR